MELNSIALFCTLDEPLAPSVLFRFFGNVVGHDNGFVGLIYYGELIFHCFLLCVYKCICIFLNVSLFDNTLFYSLYLHVSHSALIFFVNYSGTLILHGRSFDAFC